MDRAVVVRPGFCGMPDRGQGGYVGGLLARELGGGPIEVTFRAPTPLGKPLAMRAGGGEASLLAGDVLLAHAAPATLDLALPQPVPLAAAQAASKAYPGHHHHLFPDCYCCGTARAPGDGLRIFAGPLPGVDAVAAPWIPAPGTAGDGDEVRVESVWAALDCPALWGLICSPRSDPRDRVVTGKLVVDVRRPVRVGRPHVVLGWPLGKEGRRIHAAAAIFDAAGGVFAAARQVCVVTDAGAPLGIPRRES